MISKFRLLSFTILMLTIFSFAGQVYAQLDPTFGTNGVVITDVSSDDTPLESFVLPDGKILVVNQTGSTLATLNYYFVKYNADGTPDTTYGTNGIVQITVPVISPSNHILRKAVRQTDGKIILVGKDNDNGVILRYNEDGTLDTSFASGGVHRPNISIGSADGINSVVIQPDGKILVGGAAYVSQLFLLRYLSNGTLDESFGTEGYIVHTNIIGSDTMCSQLFLQSTGKSICINGNDTTTINGSVRRFNSDGSVDNTFTIIQRSGLGLVQPDDKLLLTSTVSRTETLERFNIDVVISRYNANGTVDTGFGTSGQTSFDITHYFEDAPCALQIMPDGQILVGIVTNIQANRTSLRSYTMSLARLSSSGTVNGKFLVTKAAFPSTRMFISVLPDGKILTTYRINHPTTFDANILLTRVSGVPLPTYRFRGVSFDFGFPDGVANPAVFRPSDRKWYINPTFPGYFFGLADDIPVPSDYINDFGTELAMFRPSNGTWYIARNYGNAATNFISIQWGLSDDIPVPNDYDGDGKSDLTVFRPSNGTWYIRNSADNSFTIRQWGLNGDKPAPGDFDGDGIVDIAVFRPSDGNWYIVKSSDGQAIITHFGLNGDFPIQEDYDGDGKTDISVWRPSDGIWYRLNSSDGSFVGSSWGIPADIPVPADYDGDLKTDIAIWRQTNGRWYINQSSNNSLNLYTWGIIGDKPLEAR